MRWFFFSIVLWMAEAAGTAQSTEQQALQALNRLQGVWVSQGTPERVPETMEFHWQQGKQNALLVRRHWIGDAGSSPWKLTNDVMFVYYDPASHHLQADFADRAQRRAHYQLASAGTEAVQFINIGKQGLPVYRLTYDLSQVKALSVTLEQAQNRQNQRFVVVASRRFFRKQF